MNNLYSSLFARSTPSDILLKNFLEDIKLALVKCIKDMDIKKGHIERVIENFKYAFQGKDQAIRNFQQVYKTRLREYSYDLPAQKETENFLRLIILEKIGAKVLSDYVENYGCNADQLINLITRDFYSPFLEGKFSLELLSAFAETINSDYMYNIRDLLKLVVQENIQTLLQKKLLSEEQIIQLTTLLERTGEKKVGSFYHIPVLLAVFNSSSFVKSMLAYGSNETVQGLIRTVMNNCVTSKWLSIMSFAAEYTAFRELISIDQLFFPEIYLKICYKKMAKLSINNYGEDLKEKVKLIQNGIKEAFPLVKADFYATFPDKKFSFELLSSFAGWESQALFQKKLLSEEQVIETVSLFQKKDNDFFPIIWKILNSPYFVKSVLEHKSEQSIQEFIAEIKHVYNNEDKNSLFQYLLQFVAQNIPFNESKDILGDFSANNYQDYLGEVMERSIINNIEPEKLELIEKNIKDCNKAIGSDKLEDIQSYQRYIWFQKHIGRTLGDIQTHGQEASPILSP